MATFVIGRAADDIKKTIKLHKIWCYLALDDIFARYRNTALGPLWNAAYIVAQALALSLVFGGVFHQSLKVLMPFILSGMVGWTLGPATILESAGLLIWFSGTIKTQNFPFLFYASRVVTRAGLMFLHNLVALLIVLPFFGHVPLMNFMLAPAVGLIMLISVPFCLMVGMVCARFRDIQMLVTNFSNLFFLVTPIVWMPSTLPGARSAVYLAYNPFYYMVDLIRLPILNAMPPIQDWVVCGGIAAVGWALCIVCLSAFRARIAFWV